jgi:ATP-dependent 26S proteasome regulatory subunit
LNNFVARIGKALAGGQPLIYVRCHEEERLERILAQLSKSHYADERPVHVWTATRGFSGQEAGPSHDPLEALWSVLAAPREAFYLFKDLPLLFERPDLVRALRDLYLALSGSRSFVFLSCPLWRIPEPLSRDLFTAELGAPDQQEIRADLQALVAQGRAAPPPESWLIQAAASMKGMTLSEIRHLMRRLGVERMLGTEEGLLEIRAEKAVAVMHEACLKYIPDTVDIDRVGGLENLKEWVLTRRSFFSGERADARVPPPSGVLFMGVSGCGKSMAAKVIASAWSLPLVRLDMNLVLSGTYGAPEYAFDHALQVAEQIAPMVLWIDEMENSFGYDSESHRGNNPNIFSSFLTWMQEKPPGVFVVATANRIQLLPAEVIRKGRFDQLFFLDLPTEEERTGIIQIHLRAAGADPAEFNMKTLAVLTRSWSGAEIEQAVKSASVHAWEEGREMNERDLFWSTSRIVPLSRTMSEQIKALRTWSQDRATPASRKGLP